jgi:hypothetical protein
VQSVKWRGLWGQCPHGFANDDGTVTWQRHLQWPFTRPITCLQRCYPGFGKPSYLRFTTKVGRVYITVDSTGISFEGGLWPYNNYRLDSLENMLPTDDPGVPDSDGHYTGKYNYRDHSLEVLWGLHTYHFFSALYGPLPHLDRTWRFKVTLPYIRVNAY